MQAHRQKRHIKQKLNWIKKCNYKKFSCR